MYGLKRAVLAIFLAMAPGAAAQQKPDDPFADLEAKEKAPEPASQGTWRERFFQENFGFRKEVMSEFTVAGDGNGASRQSVGFEVLKKFSTATATVASFNFQGRFVRRDGFNPVQNDMEGAGRPGWTFEYHNFYADFYNILNPVMGGERRGRNTGRFNLRVGRFYVPFGLNLQTDTHGPVLQLSNDQNFGFERDWYAGLWGGLNRHLNYDVYYLAGSGYDLKFKGQSGLGAARLSLGNRYASLYGLEGGASVMSGERLDMHGMTIRTERAGMDGRIRRPVPRGTFTWTTEASAGKDAGRRVTMQLHQAEYLHASRRWGLATQYRRFTDGKADGMLSGEFTWYLRNDIGNSNLHWVKFNVAHGSRRTVFAMQYYFYR